MSSAADLPRHPARSNEPSRLPEARRAPAAVLAAAGLMIVRAVVSALDLLFLMDKDALRRQIVASQPAADSAAIDRAVGFAVAGGLALGVVISLLYLVLALQVRRAKSWARVAALVLVGLGVLGGVLSLFQPASLLSRLVALAVLALDVAIAALLVRRASAEFVRQA